MSDEYLWDRTGEPDPGVRHAEIQLAPLRWTGSHRPTQRPSLFRPLWGAGVAVIPLICLATLLLPRLTAPTTSWTLSLGAVPRPLRVGQVFSTSSRDRGNLHSNEVGQLAVEPDSRLRLVRADRNRERFALDHGTIHALIWAPPARFIVDTPSARAVDLGCQYTLRVATDGTGFLTVETGWVAFDWHGIESFIPAEAACKTRRDLGPGTP